MQKLSNDGRGFYKKIQDKREMTFLFTHDKGLVVKTRDYKEAWEKICADRTVYSLISGEEEYKKSKRVVPACVRGRELKRRQRGVSQFLRETQRGHQLGKQMTGRGRGTLKSERVVPAGGGGES